MPASGDITIQLMAQMFSVASDGSLIISGNNGAQLTVSGTVSDESETGGFVYVDGGSFTLEDGVVISATKAKNGGAIYLNSGSCTLAGGSITKCTASVNGDAVYVAGGTLIVSDAFTLPADNDIYLTANQVITVSSGYSGKIEKITLSDYSRGRNVIDISSYPAVSSGMFVLNPDDAEKYQDLILVQSVEGGKTYLELGAEIQFSILIPDSLVISGETYDGSMKITAQNVMIPPSDKILVSVKSGNEFNLHHYKSDDIKLPYVLSIGVSGAKLTQNEQIAEFTKAAYQEKQAQNAELAVELYARLSADPRYAGDYKDTLTFTVTYIEG